jgi:hypothetical protein
MNRDRDGEKLKMCFKGQKNTLSGAQNIHKDQLQHAARTLSSIPSLKKEKKERQLRAPRCLQRQRINPPSDELID